MSQLLTAKLSDAEFFPLVLAAIVVAACSAAKSDVRRPAQPLRDHGEGRTSASCSSAEDSVFFQGRQRCGCWHGKRRCRTDDTPKCFRSGLWYSKYWHIDLTQGGKTVRCTCGGVRWDCEDISDAWLRPPHVLFQPESVELSARQREELTVWVRELSADAESAVFVIGISYAEERGDASALARRRADVVREALVRLGVAPSRLTLGPVESGKAGLVILRPRLDPPE